MTDPTDQTPPPSDVGRLVGGRYLLAEVVGFGGMAMVHRALDQTFDRTVAVKLLRREVIADADIAMRFRREALAATVLRHPNIVACLETGTDDGQPFIVMELIEGEDLAARLRRVGRLAPAEAARIGLDVARALGVAHIRGIVHRDVKPGNILLARDGRAMVTDFGIARLAADTEGAVPGTTLGSVHYFSPEQAMGSTTSAASDVYSLGLVLFESLTGERAWTGESTALLATVRIGAPAPSPRARRPEVPTTLDEIVVRALDPDPARRYANGNAMAAGLEPFVARPDPSSPTVATDTAALMAAAAAATAGGAGVVAAMAAAAGGGPPSVPVVPLVPPDQPGAVPPRRGPAAIPARLAAVPRPQPVIAGPMVILLAVVAIVGGGLFVAAISGRGGAAGLAVASATARATVAPTARPTPTAVPKPTAAPTRTPTPDPTPRPPAGGVNDLCDPILGFACGLDAGTYEPSRFTPPIRFVLKDGWSTSVWEADLITIERAEGALTFVGSVSTVYPRGDAAEAATSARGLIEAFIGTDGVAAGRPDEQKFDKRKATVVDLSPTGPERRALFGTETQTYYLEPYATTRVVVIDGKDGPFVIAIEPQQDSTLEALVPAAGAVVKSLRFR